METHYTYEIRKRGATGGDGLPYRYIGCRTCEGACDDDDYWGSSKHLPPNVRDTHRKIILGVYATRELAVADEIALHKFYNVKNNPAFYNRANQVAGGFDTQGTSFTQANPKKSLSAKHKANIAASMVGKNTAPHSESHNAKIAESLRGQKHTAARSKKIGDSLRGKPKSAAHKAAMKAAKRRNVK